MASRQPRITALTGRRVVSVRIASLDLPVRLDARHPVQADDRGRWMRTNLALELRSSLRDRLRFQIALAAAVERNVSCAST